MGFEVSWFVFQNNIQISMRCPPSFSTWKGRKYTTHHRMSVLRNLFYCHTNVLVQLQSELLYMFCTPWFLQIPTIKTLALLGLVNWQVCMSPVHEIRCHWIKRWLHLVETTAYVFRRKECHEEITINSFF